MDRRRFLMSAGAFALPIPAGHQLSFKVFRNGSYIGDHHLNFSQTGDALTVDINVALLVKIMSIPVFRYELQATECWQSGVFQSLASRVNFNGDMLDVQARKIAAGYDVVGINHGNPAKSYPRYTAPPDTMPLTYWNKQMMYSTILNIQTAHSYKVGVNSPGWNNLPSATGKTIVAQRFDLTGKLDLSVWYDPAASWSGLEFQKSGDISYQKII